MNLLVVALSTILLIFLMIETTPARFDDCILCLSNTWFFLSVLVIILNAVNFYAIKARNKLFYMILSSMVCWILFLYWFTFV